jgi:hypothetical protein
VDEIKGNKKRKGEKIECKDWKEKRIMMIKIMINWWWNKNELNWKKDVML